MSFWALVLLLVGIVDYFYLQIALTESDQLFSFLAVVLAVTALGQRENQFLETYRTSIEDEFWFRSVASPEIIDKPKKFYARTINHFNFESPQMQINFDKDSLLAVFKRQKREVIGHLAVSELFGLALRQDLEDILDELEDEVANHIYGVEFPMDSEILVDKIRASYLKYLQHVRGFHRSTN